MLNLKKPLVIFDLETTGINVTQDRIVEASFIKVMPSGRHVENTMRLNPEQPIPIESSMIHGIYDRDVKDAPTFGSVARELYQFLEGCDLAGFNLIRFDVPVLIEAFAREGIEFDIGSRKLVDAQKIFFMMEKRTLSAAYEFYCNKTLEGAHGAAADTQATLEVLQAQVERYANRPVTDMKGNEVGVIRNDVNALHQVSAANMVDLAGRMSLNEEGVEVFNFGKHKNKPVAEVLEKEANFYDWMMKGDFPQDTKRRLTEIRLRSMRSRT